MALNLKNLADELKKKLQQGVSNVGNFAKQSAQLLPPVQAYNAVKTMATPQFRQQVQQIPQQISNFANQSIQNTPVNRFDRALPQIKSNIQGNLKALSDPNTSREWANGFSDNLGGNIAKGFFNNWVAPAAQIPYQAKQLMNKNNTGFDRGMAGLQLGGNVLSTLLPGVEDVAWAGIQGVKNYNKSSLAGGNLKQNLTSFKKGATGEEFAGLGDAFLAGDSAARDILNMAELPVALLMGASIKKGQNVGFDKGTVEKFKNALQDPETRTLVQDFANMVENAKNPNRMNPSITEDGVLKDLGNRMQLMADDLFGRKTGTLSNTQLKNLFDILYQQAGDASRFNIKKIQLGASTQNVREGIDAQAGLYDTSKNFLPEAVKSISEKTDASGLFRSDPQYQIKKAQQQLDIFISNKDKYIKQTISQGKQLGVPKEIAEKQAIDLFDANVYKQKQWIKQGAPTPEEILLRQKEHDLSRSISTRNRPQSPTGEIWSPETLKNARESVKMSGDLFNKQKNGLSIVGTDTKTTFRATEDGNFYPQTNISKDGTRDGITTTTLSPTTSNISPVTKSTVKNVAQQPVTDAVNPLIQSKGVTKGVESMPSVMKTPELPKVTQGTLPSNQALQSKPLLSQTPQKPNINIKQSGQALEDIIAQGRKQIGGKIEEPKTSFKQSMDSLYTQWVDRFNPIVQASQKAKGMIKVKGATLRPEYDPEYLVRRLTGAGGIADNQFKTQLEPIIKQVETAGIPKLDLDTYLANKRMAGFGQVGRDIYGVDPQKAGQIVNALETKYPNIGQFADQLYGYQNKGFQEMVDAGFISPENAKIIQGQNPDYAPLKRVMDEVNDYLGVPTRKTMQGSQPIIKIKGSTRQIESPLESIIGNTFSQRAAIEKNRVAKAIVGLQNIAGDMGFTKAPKSDLDTITVWNNGQKEYWNVGKDIADVAKGVNEEQMNLVLKVLQAPAALLRQGATGRNPEFMIPNIVRDQLDAGITSKYGYIPFVDYVSGLKSMVANDDIYQKWANSGAKIDLGEMSGKKSIQASFDTANKKKGLFSFLGGALDTMGKYSEVPTRVGLFKKAYKKTGNDLIAALESRDATVDFARMGSKMKVANSIIPFLNVGVQGFDKLIRSVKSNPAKVLFNATLYGSVPAIATTVYNLTNHPKEYAEIPQYEKDSNFVLVKGRNQNGTVDYLTFPKGNVLPTITNPVQSFIDYLYGNNQQSFKEMALQTISSTLPVIGDGQSFNEIALKTVGSNIPQLFKPAAENILNKSFYKYDPKKEQTKDIVPFYLQDEPAYKQTYKFTPQMYQKIGALLNVSPLKVQNIMDGYLAGYSKIPAQIIESATKASKGEEISPNEKTILRRFIKQTYPTSGTKKVEAKKEAPSVMERLGMAPKAAEVPENLITYTKGDKDYEVDLNKTFTYPTMDTTTALGKEAITRYKADISSQVNKIYDAYQSGALTEQQASEYINQLSVAYDKTKKPKAAKKPKKVTIKYTTYKPQKITIKRSNVKVNPTIKKPKKLKLSRKYTIKLK